MKKELSPAVAVTIIVVIVAIVGGLIYTKTSGSAGSAKDAPPGMPTDVAAEFNKRMGTATPTGANAKGVAPSGGPPGGSGALLPPR